MTIFKCKCGQKCAITGEAARRPFVRLCSECEAREPVEPLEWYPETELKPAPAVNVAEAIQQEFFK